MNIALIGATGFVGAPLLPELLSRGHKVTVLARTPGKIAAQAGLSVVAADVLDARQVSQAVAGHDAVISAYNPGWSEPRIYELYMQGSQAIVDGVKAAGVQRLLMVGGAGSLYVAPGVQLVDTPQFPADIRPGAQAARDQLERLKKETALDWTMISPPISLVPGARTGQYRVGADELLPGKGDQPAGISVADLAVAIVDEIEQPRHVRCRFTVAN